MFIILGKNFKRYLLGDTDNLHMDTRISIAELLIRYGAKADGVNKKGASVLDVVMDTVLDRWSGQSSDVTRFVKILVEKGAQVNLDDERSILEFYEYLDRDQEVQQKITLRESPLMKAVQFRDEELVAYLIEAGADVNYVGQNSIDALGLCAVDYGKIFTII